MQQGATAVSLRGAVAVIADELAFLERHVLTARGAGAHEWTTGAS